MHDPSDDYLLNLDNDTYFDEADVEDLVGQLLTQADQTFPLPGTAAGTYRADSPLRNRLARVIAQTARRNFLVAVMTASQLADTRTVVDPAAPGFDITTLPTSVGDALDQLLDSREDGARLRGILTALAYAEGAGMDDRTWLTITGGLGYPTTQADLDALRATRVADYLLQSSTEADGRLIRLFHQALVDQLRRHRDERGDQDAITTALIDDGQRRGWANAARYTLRHLAAHAEAAGRIGQLLPDLDFLLHADLADVRRAVCRPAVRAAGGSRGRSPLGGRRRRRPGTRSARSIPGAPLGTPGAAPPHARIQCPHHCPVAARVGTLARQPHARPWKATPTRWEGWRRCRCRMGGCCWPPPAATARCGCGTRPPGPRSVTPWKATPTG